MNTLLNEILLKPILLVPHSKKLEANMNINTIADYGVGDFNASIIGNMKKLNKHVEGDMHFNWIKMKDGFANIDISRSDDLNFMSGRYTSHINIDKEKRALEIR